MHGTRRYIAESIFDDSTGASTRLCNTARIVSYGASQPLAAVSLAGELTMRRKGEGTCSSATTICYTIIEKAAFSAVFFRFNAIFV